jgi:hypothetical protein
MTGPGPRAAPGHAPGPFGLMGMASRPKPCPGSQDVTGPWI